MCYNPFIPFIITAQAIEWGTRKKQKRIPALTRPGRFDRRVPVELPDLKGREDILKVHGKAAQILAENRDRLDRLAAHLYQKETITGEKFMTLLNEA